MPFDSKKIKSQIGKHGKKPSNSDERAERDDRYATVERDRSLSASTSAPSNAKKPNRLTRSRNPNQRSEEAAAKRARDEAGPSVRSCNVDISKSLPIFADISTETLSRRG